LNINKIDYFFLLLQNASQTLSAEKHPIFQLLVSTPMEDFLCGITFLVLICSICAVYQFERESLLERQLVGIAKAKQEGKFKGRVPTAKRKSGDIQILLRSGLKPK